MLFTKAAILAFAAVAFAAPVENSVDNTEQPVTIDSVQISLPSGCTGGIKGPGPEHDCLVGLAGAGIGCASAVIMGGADPLADVLCIGKSVLSAKKIKACGKCIPKL